MGAESFSKPSKNYSPEHIMKKLKRHFGTQIVYKTAFRAQQIYNDKTSQDCRPNICTNTRRLAHFLPENVLIMLMNPNKVASAHFGFSSIDA